MIHISIIYNAMRLSELNTLTDYTTYIRLRKRMAKNKNRKTSFFYTAIQFYGHIVK